MKRHFFLLILAVSLVCFSFAQKRKIDSSAYDKWPYLHSPSLSNDGKFAFYTIENQPIGKSTISICATATNWATSLTNVSNPAFTADSRSLIFKGSGDSLGIVTLGQSSVKYLPKVNSFKVPDTGTGGWVAFRRLGQRGSVLVKNLTSDVSKVFNDVKDYIWGTDGYILYLLLNGDDSADSVERLIRVNLRTGVIQTIWTGHHAGNFVLDKKRAQIAFRTEEVLNERSMINIWYFEEKAERAEIVLEKLPEDIDSSLEIDGITEFSHDGNNLFFKLKQRRSLLSKKNDNLGLDIWSYTDSKLQSQQLRDMDPSNGLRPIVNYTAVVNLHDKKVIRLEYENDHIVKVTKNVALVLHRSGNADWSEWHWNPAFHHKYHLVSVETGEKVDLPSTIKEGLTLSPDGKYVIHYRAGDCLSYCIQSGKEVNITNSVKDNNNRNNSENRYAIAGWVDNGSDILLYDQNDIIEVDMSGKRTLIEITNGMGKKYNIAFRLMRNPDQMLLRDQDLILTAFNKTTKDNGFYKKKLNKRGDPEKLTMGSYVYYIPDNVWYQQDPPIKARDEDAYVVTRMSTDESPNLLFTRDFKSFLKLSNIHPESNFNWLKSELFTWTALDGTSYQGVLYKPDDFNASKKYPVIIYFYEKLSDNLNVFMRPAASPGPINIPSFVSNDYLVFTPDIYYKVGQPGGSALNAVVSAAKYLSGLSFVDSAKMGIQGHSFGGYETNYIVTHTDIFAAAVSAAGVSNLTSFFGSLSADGASRQSFLEFEQFRMGGPMWDKPELYIENSPVFYVKHMNSPLLIMHNKKDKASDFSQSIEFFTALRRLNKEVWLLQYDDGEHTVEGKSALDYQARLFQFFDHFLKGVPASEWMTKGVNAQRKGIIDGLNFSK